MAGSSRRIAIGGAVVALLLVAAGAMVNAAQAALSVPDWPLSYGRLLLTAWPGNVAYEQAHRWLAVLTLVLALLCVLQARAAAPVGGLTARLPKYLLLLLGLQILLGGGVVLLLDPPWIGALHLVLGVAVAAGFLANAAAPLWDAAARDAAPPAAASRLDKASRRNRTLLVLIALQILLGAVSRHPVAGQTQFIVTMVVHFVGGLVLLSWVVVHGLQLWRAGWTALRAAGALLALLAVVQLAVGVWVLIVAPEPLAPPEPVEAAFVTAHLLHVVAATGLLAVLCVVGLVLRERSGSS